MNIKAKLATSSRLWVRIVAISGSHFRASAILRYICIKNMVEIDDIEVFILTKNRTNYLNESILSLINQTTIPKFITVLDNDSEDNTSSVVQAFSDLDVKYIKTQGFLGNFNKAREIVSKKYCMLFHDDDLLHP